MVSRRASSGWRAGVKKRLGFSAASPTCRAKANSAAGAGPSTKPTNSVATWVEPSERVVIRLVDHTKPQMPGCASAARARGRPSAAFPSRLSRPRRRNSVQAPAISASPPAATAAYQAPRKAGRPPPSATASAAPAKRTAAPSASRRASRSKRSNKRSSPTGVAVTMKKVEVA